MSIEVSLAVADLTAQQGNAAQNLSSRSDAWPILFHPSRRVRHRLIHYRTTAPTLSFEREDDLLDEDAFTGRDRTRWISAAAARPLAASLKLLDETLPQGFALRAAWIGDPIDEEITITARDLAQLAAARGLTERTLYRVEPTRL